MEFLATALSGVGISVVGLCLLRSWRSRSWAAVSRVAHLTDKKLTGQVILITGGNTGLGYHAAEEFARRGAESVILACRNIIKGNEAAEKIKSITGHQNIHVLHLDLANLENIRCFATEVQERFSKIDCLVCNAGVWFPMDQKAQTEDGLEVNVGVNHLGHFLLTNLLIGKIQRIVIVSSGLMMQGKVDMDDSRQFIDGRKVQDGERVPKHAPIGYCDSKLMNAIFARELALRHKDITVISVGPGWCKTELARNVYIAWYKKLLLAPIALLFMRSSKEGSQNIIQAVLEDSSYFQSGHFYRDFQLAKRENEKVDNLMSLSSQLWTISEEATKLDKQ